MLVANNFLMEIKENCFTDDIKQVITDTINSNLYKLLQVTFTIHISTATCEW
jgi:hypothetical protein